MKKISVLLVDDHTVVRQGLRALLGVEDDIEVIGEAATGRQGVRLVRDRVPDVVVMDIAMPLLNGLEATRQIARDTPSAKVLILSSYSEDDYVDQLTDAGVAGYLVKESAADELPKAIREARKGNKFFSPAIAERIHRRSNEAVPAADPPIRLAHPLTSREAEVLQLIAEGLPNKQIAGELGISIKTIEKHRQHVMDKLNIHTIAGLTRHAIANGIVERSVATAGGL